MEIQIYGFEAEVVISENVYSGEIAELHIITQAKTLRQLKDRLEEAVELTLDAIMKNPTEARHYPSSLSKKLGVKIYA